jgi:hypothetical protein
VSRNYERLQAVLASISDAPPCCQNEASGSQNTAVPLGIMTPSSETSLWNLQSVPWTPALPETVEDYTITGVGSPTSDFFSSQLDVLRKYRVARAQAIDLTRSNRLFPSF